MKTTKLLISIALVALTALSYGRIAENNTRDNYNSAEMIVEQELVIENWMTVSFENSASDNDLYLEHWMAVPFGSSDLESDLDLEHWMTVPFVAKSIENDLCLENWMMIPFETTRDNKAESWMASSSS